MSKKNLINLLELGYAPMTAFEFAMIKDDSLIEEALEEASLYVIGQRPVITFENLFFGNEEYKLHFEIHQNGNNNVLKCKLPLIQNAVGSIEGDNIAVAFNFLDKSKKQETCPLNNLHGFSFVEAESRKFLIWFSPEKLLQNWWKGYIDCEVLGDFRSFLRYKVHYVGKATKQSILKRLTGHSTLQDILSLETPVTKMQLPANEIVILPFEFQDSLEIQSFSNDDDDDDTDSMVSALLGKNYPKQETVFLDAEKALINAMEPTYNNELFRKYPISRDGLYKHNYDGFSYTFIDPITLVYDKGEILGGLTPMGGDAIVVLDNKDLKLIKHEVQK